MVVVLVAVAGLVVVSAVVHNDRSARHDQCEAFAEVEAATEVALATADDPTSTVAEIRATADQVLIALAHLEEATEHRHRAEIAELAEHIVDLRRSLADLGDDTPSDVTRPLVADTVERTRPAAARLVAALDPICDPGG